MLGPILHTRRWSSGRLLLAGFGGLLALMCLAGVDALVVLRQAKIGNAGMRRNFLTRGHSLDQIRSGIYVSGTLARDYLLAADFAAAAEQRARLGAIQHQTETALEDYARSLSVEEAATFRSLVAEIHAYWKVLDLMLEPELQSRRQRGATYFYNQLVLRRKAMLDLADRIARRNEQEITAGDEQLGAMFDEFRLRLMVMLALTLAGGLALAGVTAARLLRSQKELEELSARLLSAQEEERRSISRELHDEVGQSLTALAMEAGTAAALAEGTPGLRQRLQSIQRLAETSMSTVRNLALLLRPSMLDDLGLVPALRWQAREVAKRSGMKVRVLADDLADTLPDAHNTCIYRVVQEALNNSVRHAHARSVRIQVSGGASNVQLAIEDDGDGFDTRQACGLGLAGMAERVRNAGGHFQIDSTPGCGTTLSVMLPLDGQKAPHPAA
jgi:signal transduction histidine kinase